MVVLGIASVCLCKLPEGFVRPKKGRQTLTMAQLGGSSAVRCGASELKAGLEVLVGPRTSKMRDIEFLSQTAAMGHFGHRFYDAESPRSGKRGGKYVVGNFRRK